MQKLKTFFCVFSSYTKCIFFLLACGSFAAIFYIKHNHVTFECLMGEKTAAWKNVHTKQDLLDLQFYKSIYEANEKKLNLRADTTRIPKVIHFIWLGPKNFPKTSKANVTSWINQHPDWKFFFWTDIDRDLPFIGMEKKLLNEFPLHRLSKEYANSSNFGEKSDLLRFEILSTIGGLYVDHDAKCLHSFNHLHENFDFYAGLEKPHRVKGLASSIFPCVGILGSIAEHPILEDVVLTISKKWDLLSKDLLKNQNPIDEWVIQRTFKNFSESVRTLIGKTHYRDIILPTSFFFAFDIFSPSQINQLSKKQKVYLRHYWANAWGERSNDILFLRKEIEKLTTSIKTHKKKHLFKKICTFITCVGLFQLGSYLGKSYSLMFRRNFSFFSKKEAGTIFKK